MNKYKKWAYMSLLSLFLGVIFFKHNCNVVGYCLVIAYFFINIKIIFEYADYLFKKG